MLVHMGLGTPFPRAFVAATVVGLGAYAIGWPKVSFDERGEMRPMSIISKDPRSTPYHFLGVPLAAGALVFLFT